jgi:hypothetical protein
LNVPVGKNLGRKYAKPPESVGPAHFRRFGLRTKPGSGNGFPRRPEAAGRLMMMVVMAVFGNDQQLLSRFQFDDQRFAVLMIAHARHLLAQEIVQFMGQAGKTPV